MINLGKHFEKTEVTKEQLQAINEVLGIKESEVWKPEYDEEYCFISGNSNITYDEWLNLTFDELRFDLGNVFKTKEEAEFARDKQIFLTKMKRDFIENSDEIDWGDSDQEKNYLCYSHIRNEVLIFTYYKLQHSQFVTTNYKWLEQYLEDNKEDIIKYYFEVSSND